MELRAKTDQHCVTFGHLLDFSPKVGGPRFGSFHAQAVAVTLVSSYRDVESEKLESVRHGPSLTIRARVVDHRVTRLVEQLLEAGVLSTDTRLLAGAQEQAAALYARAMRLSGQVIDFDKLERLAMRKRFRRTALAFELERTGLERRKGFRKAYGHAREGLEPFWARSGARPIENCEPFNFSDYRYTGDEGRFTVVVGRRYLARQRSNDHIAPRGRSGPTGSSRIFGRSRRAPADRQFSRDAYSIGKRQ